MLKSIPEFQFSKLINFISINAKSNIGNGTHFQHGYETTS